LLAVQSAQLAVMVHMLLRLDQRAAWSVLQDHSPLPLQRPAHPVMLGRTPQPALQLATLALRGHIKPRLEQGRALIVLQDHPPQLLQRLANPVELGLTTLMPVQLASSAVMVRIILIVDR
jgi:uncharacterized protein (DUF2249 family)